MPSFHPPAEPGFWWSPVDPFVLATTTVLTAAAWPRIGPVAGLAPVIVGHYFLFCNIVRLRPWREALWAITFLWVAAVLVLGLGVQHWLPITAAILPFTGLLVLEEVRSATYRGVGAPRR